MPHRLPLLHTLSDYETIWQKSFASFPEQQQCLEEMRAFITSSPHCFKRSNTAGHITGSALVLSQDLKKVLLTHHAKIKKWLHLGGHADGEIFVHEVALREAREESGLTSLAFYPFCAEKTAYPALWDIDIHPIAATATVPEHLHYDLSFLLVADENEPLTVTPESLDLKWIPLENLSDYTQEKVMQRQIAKLCGISPGVNWKAPCP